MDLPRHARGRRRLGPGRWQVRARLERFTEPAVLLVLRDNPGHGYELLEKLQELMPAERIDMGNLYRILRSLERDVITQSGRRVLAQWVEAFSKIERQIERFRKRYEEQRG